MSIVYSQAELEPTRVQYSPDGSMIAVSGGLAGCQGDLSRFAIPIYSAVTGQLVKSLQGINCTSVWLDWSPDGTRLLAVTSPESKIYIWDIATEELVLSFPTQTQGILMALWSSDGNVIAGSFGGTGVLFWDADTGERWDVSLAGTSFDWSPDGSQLVLGSGYDTLLTIADFSLMEDVQQLADAPDVVYTVDWSADGTRIAAVSANENAIVWDVDTGEIILSLSVPALSDVAWNPDSRRLATSSYDGLVQVWDTETAELLAAFTDDGRLLTVGWSPDGNHLAYTSTSSVLNIVEVPSLSSAHSQSNLRGLFSYPDCVSSCWLGIQPNISTAEDVEYILDIHGIEYEKFPLGQGEDLFFYHIVSGYSNRFISPNAIVVYTLDGIVTTIDFGLQDVEINTVIAEYTYPEQILEDGSSVDMVYRDEGLVFGVIASDYNHVFRVYMTSTEIINNVHRQGWTDFVPCADDNQLCALSRSYN